MSETTAENIEQLSPDIIEQYKQTVAIPDYMAAIKLLVMYPALIKLEQDGKNSLFLKREDENSKDQNVEEVLQAIVSEIFNSVAQKEDTQDLNAVQSTLQTFVDALLQLWMRIGNNLSLQEFIEHIRKQKSKLKDKRHNGIGDYLENLLGNLAIEIGFYSSRIKEVEGAETATQAADHEGKILDSTTKLDDFFSAHHQKDAGDIAETAKDEDPNAEIDELLDEDSQELYTQEYNDQAIAKDGALELNGGGGGLVDLETEQDEAKLFDLVNALGRQTNLAREVPQAHVQETLDKANDIKQQIDQEMIRPSWTERFKNTNVVEKFKNAGPIEANRAEEAAKVSKQAAELTKSAQLQQEITALNQLIDLKKAELEKLNAQTATATNKQVDTQKPNTLLGTATNQAIRNTEHPPTVDNHIKPESQQSSTKTNERTVARTQEANATANKSNLQTQATDPETAKTLTFQEQQRIKEFIEAKNAKRMKEFEDLGKAEDAFGTDLRDIVRTGRDFLRPDAVKEREKAAKQEHEHHEHEHQHSFREDVIANEQHAQANRSENTGRQLSK